MRFSVNKRQWLACVLAKQQWRESSYCKNSRRDCRVRLQRSYKTCPISYFYHCCNIQIFPLRFRIQPTMLEKFCQQKTEAAAYMSWQHDCAGRGLTLSLLLSFYSRTMPYGMVLRMNILSLVESFCKHSHRHILDT